MIAPSRSTEGLGEHQLFAKCAWRLIPFMMLIYFVNFLDRTNVAFAALTMNKDLGFTPSVYGLGAGLFFVGYFLFEVPSNLILARVGARFWIFRIMLTWGILSAACALIQGPVSFFVLRFLLGIAEAGLYPGMLLYLTYWFPQASRARFLAAFIAAAPLSTVIGGPVSGFILDMNGVLGLKGWQWLFLIEGVPASILGFAVLKFLPNGPESAPWLTPDERRRIASRLADETVASPHRDIWSTLCDPRVLALAATLFGTGFARFGVGLWLPLIVQGMGFSNVGTGFVVAFPYLAAVCAMFLWGRSSDLKGERIWHVAGPVILGALSLLAASVSSSGLVLLLAVAVVIVCIEAVQGVFWTLPSTFLGSKGSAAGVAIIAATGQFGAFTGSSIMGVLKQGTGDYTTGWIVLAAALTMSASIVLAFGRAAFQSANAVRDAAR